MEVGAGDNPGEVIVARRSISIGGAAETPGVGSLVGTRSKVKFVDIGIKSDNKSGIFDGAAGAGAEDGEGIGARTGIGDGAAGLKPWDGTPEA